MASISQEEIDQRIAAYGGGAMTHSPKVGTRKVPNPVYGIGEGQDASADKEVEVAVQRWESPDGALIEAYQLPDRSWVITQERPAPPKPTSANPNTPARPVGGKRDIEGTPDPSKPGGFDNERPRWVWRDDKGNEVYSEPVTGKDLDDWREARERSRNPGGKTDAEIQAEKDRNKPGPATLKPDGKGGTIAVQTMPDGSIKTTPLPGVTSEATSKYTEIKQDPNTGKWHGLTRAGTWEEISGGPGKSTKDDFPGEPADAPPTDMTPGRVAEGLRQYSSYLAQQVKLWRDTGGKQGVSPENATKLMEQRIKLAEVAGRESNNLASQQQGIYNTQVTQRGQNLAETASRRGDANAAYNNNLSRFMPQITMSTPGGETAIARGLMSSLDMNQDYVQRWGGFRESPDVPLPTFLNQVRDASMAGIQTAAQGGPRIFESRAPAAGAAPAPAVRPAFLPQAPVSAAEASANAARAAAEAAGGVPTPGEPGGPPLTPGPVLQAPAPPAPAANPINAQPIPAPALSVPTRHPEVESGASDPQTNYGVPTFDPNAPAPTPVGLAPSFLSQARYGYAYDPRARAAALGIRPDILELALAG